MNDMILGVTGENRVHEVEDVPDNPVACEFTVRFDQTGAGTYQDLGKIQALDARMTRSILSAAIKRLKSRRNPTVISGRQMDWRIDKEELTISLSFIVPVPVGSIGTTGVFCD